MWFVASFIPRIHELLGGANHFTDFEFEAWCLQVGLAAKFIIQSAAMQIDVEELGPGQDGIKTVWIGRGR